MMKKNRVVCLLIVMVILSCAIRFQFQPVSGAGWLSGWNYRQSHAINSASGAGTNYQMRIKAIYDAGFCEQSAMAFGLGSFEGSDVDSSGNIYVGYQYKIYKSIDNGKAFSLIYTIPSQSNPYQDYAGRIWCVFIDSRDYIFVSAGSTNRLYRSTDGGTSFSEVLNLNRASNNGQITNMAEDQNGYLYGAEFCAAGSSPNPRLWKSADGGANWSSVRSWDAGHLHGVHFNPFNNFLYVLTGETIGSERDRVYRSKNGGSSWQILVDTQSINVPYLACEFVNDHVYLGQDMYTATCNIQRFQDNGASEPFTPTTVFSNPYSRTPWFSSTKVGDYLVFAGCRDVDNGNALLVKSLNGVDWEIVATYSVDSNDRLLGQLTTHARKGQAFVTIHKTASTYLTSTSSFDIVGLNQKCRADFGDVRFTKSDGTTLLDYWIEEKTDGDKAIFWIEVADDLSTVDRTIYTYYGKNDATSISGGPNTFLLFDDFLGSSWDTNTWQTVGSPSISVSDSKITVSKDGYSGSWSAHGLKTKTFMADEARILTKAKTSSTHASITAGYACSQFTSKGARNGFGFSGGYIFNEADGRDEGETFTTAWDQAYSTDTFYSLFLYRWETSYAKEFIDGNYKNQVTSSVRDGNRNIAVWIEEWGTYSGSRDLTVDWVAVAKYVDPEPSHGSWGNEEIVQLTPPNFGIIGVNSTIAGSPFEMSCPVNSTTNVSSYLYSWNNTGSWANQTAAQFTNFINSSAAYATFSDTWNTVAGNVVSVKIYANDTLNNWGVSSEYNFVIASSSASRLVFTSGAAQSLTANELSSMITIQRQDQYGNPVTSGSLTASLGSTSGGATFYSDAGVTHASFVTISDGSSIISFWYADTVADSPVLTASASGLTSGITTVIITSTDASKLVFTVGVGQSLTAGQLSGQVAVQRRDQYGNPVTSGSLTVNLSSSSLGSAFYSDNGTTQASTVTINDGSSSFGFWYKDTVADSPTLNVSATGLSPATTSFLITSDNLNHFTITEIPNPQTAGTTFNIMITAADQYGNIIVSYTGSNILSDLSGTISPTSTSSFSEGVWNGSVTITKAYHNDIISTSSSGYSGATNSFDVHPCAFDHFVMSSYPSSVVTGQSFNITVTAWDAFGNVVTGYAGQVYFISSDGQALLPYTTANRYAFTLEDNGSHTFTGFELNTVSYQTITVTDSMKSATSNLIAAMLPISPPSYSSISVSATFAGQSCTFYSGWNDNYGLSGYIFSTNNTGLWQNTTWTPFLGTPSLASVTQNLNSNIGAVIGYNWYANNTNGLWNDTGLQTLTTVDSELGLSFSVISNSTVSELVFNSTSQVLEFTVSGLPGTIGFTNVTIAKTLISDVSTLKVYLDGSEMNYTINDLTYHWLIHFTYPHSVHKIVLDFLSPQTKTPVTPLNGVPVTIAGLAIAILTTLTIATKRITRAKFPNFTRRALTDENRVGMLQVD